MSKVLGISAFYHDSAAALTVDGRIVAAVQEERFTRNKHTSEFPIHAIKYCLEEAGCEIDDLDAVVFYDKPLLKFERLLQTYYSFAPKGLISFLKAMPVWLKEKLFLKKLIYEGLKQVGPYKREKVKLLFSEHHLSHAASTFYTSPFKQAVILTIDGVGEWCTASIGLGEGNQIKIYKEMEFPHSVGLLYSAFTYFLGFKVNSGEYKLMGLAPYGSLCDETQEYIRKIEAELVDIKIDGSIWLNQKYFSYATGLKMVVEEKWEKLFGFGRRLPEANLEQKHCNLALAIQTVIEKIVLKMAQEAKRLTNADYLCMAGGVALNCVANGKLLQKKLFKEIYIQPASGDAGGAIGAALAVEFMYFGEERFVEKSTDPMNGTYLGPQYSEKEIQMMNRKMKSVFHKYDNFSALTEFIGDKIAEGNVVGWFQGRMEFGPRALGNRSILGDPRNPEMQKKINTKIKFREEFRPFAPSILEEVVSDYFELEVFSPYMLLVAPVRKERRVPLPMNYSSLPMWEKLNCLRSDIQSVTHLDYSVRIQTVNKTTNPRYWELLNTFKEKTGYGLLINTSLNVRGEPIVCTPYDAYCCFMSTDMDYLVIESFVYCKNEQPNWQNKAIWQQIFASD